MTYGTDTHTWDRHTYMGQTHTPMGQTHIPLWPILDIFIQKVLDCKYQLQMNLIDLLDIERP